CSQAVDTMRATAGSAASRTSTRMRLRRLASTNPRGPRRPPSPRSSSIEPLYPMAWRGASGLFVRRRGAAAICDTRRSSTILPPGRGIAVGDESIREHRSTLARSVVFEHLTPDELDLIIESCRSIEAQPGQILLSEGQRGDGLYVILAGEVEFFLPE